MIIGLDIDEVLAGFLDTFLRYYNQKHKTHWNKDQMTDYYRLEKDLETTEEHIVQEISLFNESPLFAEMKPVKGSLEGVAELKKSNHLYLITGRKSELKVPTEEWLNKYFGDSFKEIYFTNLFSEYKVSKSKVCKDIGAKLLIEDIPEIALECAKEGIDVLVPSYSWNKKLQTDGKVKKVEGWKGILESFYVRNAFENHLL